MAIKICCRENRQAKDWSKTNSLVVYVLACSAFFIIAAADRSYRIQLDKFVLVNSDETFGNFSEVHMVKYNRSTSALSGLFEVFVDPRPDLLLSIEGYEKVGTQYVLSGIQIKEEPFCGLIQKYGKLVLPPEDSPVTNFTFGCPITKGLYAINNYRPDENNMPEDVPGNDWRFDMKARYPEQLDNFIFHFQAFVQVIRDVTNWKPGVM